MRKIALLLFLAAMPALSQIRSDQALAPVVFGAAPPRQESARVASDGTNFFVVWRMRTASNAMLIGGGRISPAGELLDRPSILIGSGPVGAIGGVDVVFVGGNFLVAYQSGTSVLTRRFSREGRPVDIQPVTISNSSMFAGLATNGTTVLLPTASNRIRMLAADGTTLGPELAIPDAGGGSLSIASNGDRYLMAISSDGSGSGLPYGAIVLLTGMGYQLETKPPLTGPLFLNGVGPLFLNGVAVASNGTSFLVGITTPGLAACMHVDADGNIGALHRLDGSLGRSVVATWSGGEYTLVWSRLSTLGRDIVGARVDAGGQPIDTKPVTVASAYNISYSGTVYASAWNGRDTMIITGEDSLTTAAMFTSLPQIDAEPAARRRVAIASSAAVQDSGSIASNGTLSLVTWRENADQTMVRAAFIAADGQLGAPIDLGNANSLTGTVTASNGRDFLVAYYDTSSRLVARRVTLEGVLDPTPIVITIYGMPTHGLAAGWSGQAYVVVTTGYDSVTISGLTADGTLARSPQGIDTNVPADSPAVSCAANGCSVTWHRASPPCYILCAYIENDVFARTDAIGNLVAQAFLTDFDFVTRALSIPARDDRSVFVYSNGKSMFAGRITAAGVVLDAPAVNGGRRVMTSETSFALLPVGVIGSGLYFVEPDDYRSGRLYWTRIEPEPVPHVTSLINLHQSLTVPVTLTASARNTYIVYSRGEDDPALMAPRLFLRTLASPDPQPSLPRRRAAR